MFRQLLTPVADSLPLSFVVAALPVLTVLVLLGVMLGHGPRWPAGLGGLAGIGIVGVVIGAIGAVAGPGVWAASGLALLGVASGTFWWLRCRPAP